jgi:CHAT domain-containing protein
VRARSLYALSVLVVVVACSGGVRDQPPDGIVDSVPGTSGVTPAASPGVLFDSLFNVAQEIYFAGEYDSAVTLLTDLREQARVLDVASTEARALTWIGLAYRHLGDHRASRRIGEEALAVKQQHSLTDQYFRSYNALGLLAWTENRFTDASRLFEQAVDAARAAGDRGAEAVVMGNLALVQTELGQFSAARDGFIAMREAGVEFDEWRWETNALTNLGMLEIRLGSPQLAIPLLRDALDVYERVEFWEGTQSALGQLGAAYSALGDPAQAFAALDSAFGIATVLEIPQEQASILEFMAEIYRSAGHFPRALDLYDSAKTINAELGLDLETGIDLRGEADIHVRLGDLTRARNLTVDALEIHHRTGAPLEELRDHLLLAEILDRLDEPRSVQERLREARNLADEVGARIARVEVGLAEARIADRHRRSRQVLEVIDRIQPDLARGGYTAEWEAHWLQSRALERLGKSEQAAVAGRRALATVERVRGNFGSGLLRTAFVTDKGEVYDHLVSVLLRLGEVDEAFEIADGARGRALLEQLGTTARDDGAANAMTSLSALSEGETLLRRIDRLVESIDLMEELPLADRTDDESAELARLYDTLEAARREYEGLLIQAAETNPGAAAFLGGARTDVGAVRAALGAGQLLVEYFVPAEGRVVIFVVSRDDVRVLESPINAENLTSRVRLVRDLISRPEAASDRSHGVLAGLHEALIQPAIRGGLLGEAQELIVVPHGVLNYLPFAALRDRTTDRYLVEEYTLRVLPSAAALPVLRSRAVGGGAQESGSVFAPFPRRLPGTRQEARVVAASRSRTRRHEGSRATERALRKALEGSGLVHVATHGLMNVRNPLFSRLELARNGADDPKDDGRLEVHELLELSIGAPVVFLSGCETGVGAAYSTAFAQGEDYATLAQAFLYAGAGNVIATLWPVEDAGAAAFAEQFYRTLDESSPGVALAEAQRAILSHARYSAPYYWAAYQLAGDGGRGRIPHTPAPASVP